MFTINLPLPSGKSIRVSELSNRDYIAILKFCENSDYSGLNDFFNQLYFTPDLDIFDRFFVLISIRELFIGSTVKFVGKGSVTVSYRLSDMLSKLTANYVELDKTLECGDIKIKVGVPVESYFKSIDDLYIDVIRSIKREDVEVNFALMTDAEKKLILDRLPTSVFRALQQYVNELSDSLFDLTIIEGNANLEISEVKVNILGNGVMYFVASIFAYDLLDFYEMYYYYNNMVNPGAGDFYDITFNEANLLFKIHEARIKRENDEIKRNKRS